MEDKIKELEAILEMRPQKIILRSRRDKSCQYTKMVIRPVILKGKGRYQIERFTEKQVFHENIEEDELKKRVIVNGTSRQPRRVKYCPISRLSLESGFRWKVLKMLPITAERITC